MSVVQGVLIHEPEFVGDDTDDRRNVSKLHRELQHRAIRWMANRLIPCYAAIEIGYGRGAICDALAVGSGTQRLGPAVTAYEHRRGLVIRCEAKASRSDFMACFGPKAPPLMQCGNLSYLVKPRLLDLDLSVLPYAWGVLEAYGTGLSVKRTAHHVGNEHPEDVFAALVVIIQNGSYGMRVLRVPCPDCAGGGKDE